MDSYLDLVERAHDRFVHYASVDLSGIPSPVLDSWHRCRRSEVDPRGGIGDPIPEDSVAARREQHRQLIEVAGPQMRAMYSTVRGSGFVVNLIDTDGYILEMVGDPEIIDNAQALNFEVGANWAEREVGTNAISLALDNRRPVQVAGAEHYCFSHHTWTCSAAPVFDAQGTMRAVLNMSAPAHFRHPHTLGMIISGTTAIGAQLKLLSQAEHIARARDRLSAIVESISEGMMCVDRQGRITRINSWLAHQLGVGRDSLVGTSIASLGVDEATLEELLSKESLRNRELSLSSGPGGGIFYVSGQHLEESGAIEPEVVLTFHGTQKTKRLVHQVMGNRAHYTFSDLITQDPVLLEAVELSKTVAHVDSSVVLQGESGTGKEILAHAIHNEGSRRTEAFVAINCAAIPRELMESELFGYDPGAFSGAHKNGNPGKFELADGGTLFLDEIGEMPVDMQNKLLRVIQEKVLHRIGGKQAIPVDVRIIAATNRNLTKLVESGEFRHDLYYRLNVFNIAVPALRERTDDIPLLAEHFRESFNRRHGRGLRGFDEPAMARLQCHPWPGNVRELQNVVERVVMTASGPYAVPADLPGYLQADGTPRAPSGSCADPEDIRPHSMNEVEREAILQALAAHDGNVTHAARELGIGRNTLYRKLRRHRISVRQPAE